jgi:serine/threonine-protein kinase
MSQPANDATFGQAAVRLGFTDEARVRECLEVQAKMKEMGLAEPLGEILVKKGYLSQAQRTQVLKNLGVQTSQIPGYQILSKLGQGGMGTVYKALQASVNRTVAIKVLSPAIVKDRSFVTRFFKEAQATARLSHRNLITAIDAGEANGICFFVMEYVDGPSLRHVLNKSGPLDEKLALDVAAQMADVLDHIHRQNMVHRDVKPENMLLTTEGVVKLCDLGLAKSTLSKEASQALTQEGTTIGTPYYMSPEQIRGDADVDIRSDLYSLGASLFHLAGGRHPYDGKSSAETMSLHLNAPVPDPRTAAPGMSGGFATVIVKLLQKAREDRYQTPAELIEDLKRVRAGSPPVHARRGGSEILRGQTRRKVHEAVARARNGPPVWLIPAGAGLVAAVVVTVFLLSGGSPSPGPAPVAVQRPEAPPARPAVAPAAPETEDATEAARLFASAEQLVSQEKWKEAREDLRRLLDRFPGLVYTKSKSEAIGKMIALCDARVLSAEVAREKRLEDARTAFREGRWKEARPLLTDLVRAGRSEFRADLETCEREIAAEDLFAALGADHEAKRWTELQARIGEFRQKTGGTRTLQKSEAALERYDRTAAAELEAARLISEARTAALQKQWESVADLLTRVEVLRATDAYQKASPELAELRKQALMAGEKGAEDAAAAAWLVASEEHEKLLARKEYDPAIEKLTGFVKDHGGTKLGASKLKDIEAKTAEAKKRRTKDREDEAARLWQVAQKEYRAKSWQAALEAIVRIQEEFPETPAARSNERTLKQYRTACEKAGAAISSPLLALDFEEATTGWIPFYGKESLTLESVTDAYKSKRAVRFAFSGPAILIHPLKGLDPRADTISFWAKTTRRNNTGGIILGLGQEKMEGLFLVALPAFTTEWKQYSFRISEFRFDKADATPPVLDREKVSGLVLGCPREASLEMVIDALRVEAAKPAAAAAGGGGVLLDFESEQSAWQIPEGIQVTAQHAEEPYQGKRSARLFFNGTAYAAHPISPLDAKSETVSFWAKCRKWTGVPVYLAIYDGDDDFRVQMPKIGAEWKQYVFRLSDFKVNPESKGNKTLDRELVQVIAIGCVSDATFELFLDDFRIDSGKR